MTWRSMQRAPSAFASEVAAVHPCAECSCGRAAELGEYDEEVTDEDQRLSKEISAWQAQPPKEELAVDDTFIGIAGSRRSTIALDQ